MVINDYYLVRPHTLRCALVLLIFALSLNFSILFQWKQESAYLYLAYAAVFVAIIGNESLIWRWRVVRNRRLAELGESSS